MTDPVRLEPCPFCGQPADPTGEDTLYPTGTYWRETGDFRHYVSCAERKDGDEPVWSMNCPETYGGCGAEIHGDTREQAIAKWNRRAPARDVQPDDARDTARLDWLDSHKDATLRPGNFTVPRAAAKVRLAWLMPGEPMREVAANNIRAAIDAAMAPATPREED